MQCHFYALNKEIDGLCSLCGVYRAGKGCFLIVKGTYFVRFFFFFFSNNSKPSSIQKQIFTCDSCLKISQN